MPKLLHDMLDTGWYTYQRKEIIHKLYLIQNYCQKIFPYFNSNTIGYLLQSASYAFFI